MTGPGLRKWKVQTPSVTDVASNTTLKPNELHDRTLGQQTVTCCDPTGTCRPPTPWPPCTAETRPDASFNLDDSEAYIAERPI
ncbi:unnamed protein product [Lota lota]